jgi:hypothetical protein
MEWYEVLAWVIIAVAFVTAAVWCIRRIVCPTSQCENCDKDCALKRKKTN